MLCIMDVPWALLKYICSTRSVGMLCSSCATNRRRPKRSGGVAWMCSLKVRSAWSWSFSTRFVSWDRKHNKLNKSNKAEKFSYLKIRNMWFKHYYCFEASELDWINCQCMKTWSYAPQKIQIRNGLTVLFRRTSFVSVFLSTDIFAWLTE